MEICRLKIEVNAWKETAEILSDTQLIRELTAAEKRASMGQMIPADEMLI